VHEQTKACAGSTHATPPSRQEHPVPSSPGRTPEPTAPPSHCPHSCKHSPFHVPSCRHVSVAWTLCPVALHGDSTNPSQYRAPHGHLLSAPASHGWFSQHAMPMATVAGRMMTAKRNAPRVYDRMVHAAVGAKRAPSASRHSDSARSGAARGWLPKTAGAHEHCARVVVLTAETRILGRTRRTDERPWHRAGGVGDAHPGLSPVAPATLVLPVVADRLRTRAGPLTGLSRAVGSVRSRGRTRGGAGRRRGLIEAPRSLAVVGCRTAARVHGVAGVARRSVLAVRGRRATRSDGGRRIGAHHGGTGRAAAAGPDYRHRKKKKKKKRPSLAHLRHGDIQPGPTQLDEVRARVPIDPASRSSRVTRERRLT
jgi:hypothetical protein